jgi:hypothetical protein
MIFAPMKLKSILTISLGALALGFAGCDGGSSSDNDSGSTGPANSAAFAGTTIVFNPTVEFTAGNNLTYTNAEDSPFGSTFPEADTPVAGTYTYEPSADFTQGTLTLNVGTDVIIMQISDFVRSGPNVTGFTARIGGRSYPVTVTGTLPAYDPGDGSGLGPGESRAEDIPDSIRGTYEVEFNPGGTPPDSGDFPEDGDTATVEIRARRLIIDGRTLTDPVFLNDDITEWFFKDGSVTYGVTGTVSGGLEAINVYGPIDITGEPAGPYGRYEPVEDVDPEPTDVPPTGSYPATVTSATASPGFPVADTYIADETATFTFGSNSLTVDGATYTYRGTETPASSGARAFVYERLVDTFTDTIHVSTTNVGGVNVPQSFLLSRTRNAEAPATGTADGLFVFEPTSL